MDRRGEVLLKVENVKLRGENSWLLITETVIIRKLYPCNRVEGSKVNQINPLTKTISVGLTGSFIKTSRRGLQKQT